MTAGSSVPEAARAAAWEAVSHRIGPIQPETFLAAAKAYADGGPAPLAAAVIAAIQQFAPTIVAAAVAEERATTGRRIEAALAFRDSERGVSCAGYSVDDDGCFVAGLAARVRAALASPGEES